MKSLFLLSPEALELEVWIFASCSIDTSFFIMNVKEIKTTKVVLYFIWVLHRNGHIENERLWFQKYFCSSLAYVCFWCGMRNDNQEMRFWPCIKCSIPLMPSYSNMIKEVIAWGRLPSALLQFLYIFKHCLFHVNYFLINIFHIF